MRASDADRVGQLLGRLAAVTQTAGHRQGQPQPSGDEKKVPAPAPAPGPGPVPVLVPLRGPPVQAQGASSKVSGAGGLGPGQKPSSVITCNGMQHALTKRDLAVARTASGGRPLHLSSQKVHDLLVDIEQPYVPTGSQAGSSRRGGAEDHSHMACSTRGSVQLTYRTFAETAGGDGLDGHPSASEGAQGRLNRKEQREEARAKRIASRAVRQAAADDARVRYGLSAKDRKDRSKREEKLKALVFDAAQADAVRQFGHRAWRVILANLIALTSQVFFLYDVYQPVAAYKLKSRPAGIEKPSQFAAMYTFAGICGSALAISAVLLVSATIWGQGLKAQKLERVCIVAVHMQYYSGFFQLLSLINQIAYLPKFFERALADYPASPAWMTPVKILEMILASFLPLLLLYTIFQTREICYSNLQYIASTPVIQRAIFGAIRTCQITSGILVGVTCSLNLVRLLSTVDVTVGEVTAESSIALLINYSYFIFPAVGVAGVLLGVFYAKVTSDMHAYNIEVEGLEARRAEMLIVGQRVPIAMGNFCVLQHLVDKPLLNGERAEICCGHPNEDGMITVLCGVEELKIEEFQMRADLPAGELERAEELAHLRAAEFVYKFERRGERNQLSQMIYVTIGQVVVGFLILFIIMLLTTSSFNGLGVYYAYVFSQGLQSSELCRNANITAAIQRNCIGLREKLLQRTCTRWSRCLANLPRPRECGSCVVPLDVIELAGIDPQQVVQKDWLDGAIFGGSSFASVIIGLSVGGCIGLVIGYIVMRKVAVANWRHTCCTSVFLLVIFAAVGFAGSATVFLIQPEEFTLTSPQCGVGDDEVAVAVRTALAPDVASGLTLDGTVPTSGANCLITSAANYVIDLLVEDGRQSVTSCLITMLYFLFESLAFLSTVIQARGPNQWARFEAIVFLVYGMAINLLTIACSFFFRQGNAFPYFESLQSYFNTANYFADVVAASEGDSFPFAERQLWAFKRQGVLGTSFWYNIGFNLVVNGSLFILQLIGVIVTLTTREEVWIKTLRYLLLLGAVMCLTVNVVVIVMTLQAINLVHNILSFLYIPNGVQFCFAILYATQSDILPIFANLPTNNVLKKVALLSIAIPVIGMVMGSVGLATHIFYRFDQTAAERNIVIYDVLEVLGFGPPMLVAEAPNSARSLSSGLMVTGFSLCGLFAIIICVRFARTIYEYAWDSSSMALQYLASRFPSVFAPDEKDGGAEAGARKA